MAEESKWKDGIKDVVAEFLQQLRCGEWGLCRGGGEVQCQETFTLNDIVLPCSCMHYHYGNHKCYSSNFKVEWWDTKDE